MTDDKLLFVKKSVRGGVIVSAASLTARELEVLRLVAGGYTYRQISAMLSVSVATVSSHMGSVRRKLGCTSTAQAVAVAAFWGLIL
jgi:DNA-binding CsgD family transcriptional regulator